MESTENTGVSYEVGLRPHAVVCCKSMKKLSRLRFDEKDYLRCTLLCLTQVRIRDHMILKRLVVL